MVASLYIIRTTLDKFKKSRKSKNQVAPIPMQSLPSIRISDEESNEGLSINNVIFNQEIIHTRFLFFILLIIFMYSIPTFCSYLFPQSSTLKVFEKSMELGFQTALFFVFMCMYPYLTNESLRKFCLSYLCQ